MLSALLSRLIILVCGTLYPAYASHKAVKTKNVKEYVKWMMYWIVFALYTFVEIFTDIFVSFWMPCYYELKILFVIWLTCPATKGSSYLYRKIVHPYLQNHEDQLDAYLDKIWDHGYEFCRRLGSHGVSYLAELITELLKKGQMTVVTRLPMIMELAQETARIPDSSRAPAHAVDGGSVDFEDFDVVEPHEVGAVGFSCNDDEDSMAFAKSFPDGMDMSGDNEISSVESRPLRLRSSHPAVKEESSVPTTAKSGKVRQRKNAKK